MRLLSSADLEGRLAALKTPEFTRNVAIRALEPIQEQEDPKRLLGGALLHSLDLMGFKDGMTPIQIQAVRRGVRRFIDDITLELPPLPKPLPHTAVLMSSKARSDWFAERQQVYVDSFVSVLQPAAFARYLTYELHIAKLDQFRRDPLTGLYVRRAGDEVVQEMINENPDQLVGVILHDVDHFKRFNDVYGHIMGDQVLGLVGSVLTNDARLDDVLIQREEDSAEPTGDFLEILSEAAPQVGGVPARAQTRQGGEEFLEAIKISRLGVTASVAQRQRRSIQSCTLEGRPDIRITASSGVAEGPVSQFATLVVQADEALYRAKKAGRNCTWVYGMEEAEPRDG